MAATRGSLTNRTVARALIATALATTPACTILFPFDDFAPTALPEPSSEAAAAETGADRAAPDDGTTPNPDGGGFDASVPDAARCDACASGFCSKGPNLCDFVVFVTLATVAGNIPTGGLGAATSRCTSEATGLPGSFQAWLSADGMSVVDRLAPTESRPYRRLDGQLVALDYAELHSGSLRNPINIAPDRSAIVGAVWTGSSPTGGAITSSNCSGWMVTSGTGAYGMSNDKTGGWSNTGSGPCLSANRLYCIQTAP